MRQARMERISVGGPASARDIAALVREGRSPGLVWLCGLRSDMSGSKAEAVDSWAAASGHACLRFDYSGHGQSGGRFEDGTISRWLEETEAVFRAFTQGPQIVLGSSMGGWMALLLARRLRESGMSDRLAGMILLAPAVDMTKELMLDKFSRAERRALSQEGFLAQPSAYSEEPTIITGALIEDGQEHLFGDAPIETGCRVHVIQGMQDPDIPWQHATALMERLAFDDAVLTLVRDGDHRLSRPEDIARLIRAVEEMVAG